MYVSIYVHTYIHTYIHTYYIYTYIHTYIYSVGQKNWRVRFFAIFISKINSYEVNIISVDSIFQ